MIRKLICMILAISVFCTGFCALADNTFTAVVSYIPESGEITVNGSSSKGEVVVMIIPVQTSTEELGESKLPVAIRPFSVSGGNYSFTLGIPSYTPGGKYTVYVSHDGREVTDTFIYMNIASAEAVIPLLNEADGEAFAILVSDNAINLGIDVEDAGYIHEADAIFGLLDKMNFEDIYDFYDKYVTAYAICMIEGAASNDIVALNIQKYAQSLGIDYVADFTEDDRLTDAAKNELLSLLACTDFSSEANSDGSIDFKEIMTKLKPLAAVRCSENWVGLKDIITEDFVAEFEDMLKSNSKYAKIKDTDTVYTEMMKFSFETFEDVENAFKSAVNRVYNNENKKDSSSGGGGGGSLSAGISTPPAAELGQQHQIQSKSTFADIDESHWAYKAVSSLSEDKVISGYEDGTFRPSNYITRAEFTKIILAFAEDVPQSENKSFNDVGENDWFYTCVMQAAAKGLVSGNGDGFAPGAYIKREDAALIVYRLLTALGREIDGYRPFADRKDISTYAEDAVYALAGEYIINGNEDNLFLPQNNITRAEAAQLIFNAMK